MDGNGDKQMLIDSQSTTDVFKDKSFITGIPTLEKPCRIKCSTGSMRISKKGFFGKIPVWYHPKGVANIILLKTLKSLHRGTYDSLEENGVFKVHTPQGIVKFWSHKKDLHYLELNKEENS